MRGISQRAHIGASLRLVGLVFLAGCAATFRHELNFDPNEPLRVAVLPFSRVSENGAVIEESAALAVDKVPLLSSPLQPPEELLRGLVENGMKRSGLDVISPALVDDNLFHRGYWKTDAPDRNKIFSAPHAELCEILSCDALVYGRIKDWDRAYYGLQSQAKVGLELKMIAAKSGKVLFYSYGADSASRGILKGPTGFASLVLEPIKGLDSEIIADLAQNVVNETLEPLQVGARQGYLESAPPSLYGSSHTAKNGALTHEQILTVLALGSPKQIAFFSIGSRVENVPMVERSEGHYIGEFRPLPTDHFGGEPVVVHLKDSYGRVSSQVVAFSPVSLGASEKQQGGNARNRQ